MRNELAEIQKSESMLKSKTKQQQSVLDAIQKSKEMKE